MQKNILIVVLTVITALSLLYAFIQKQKADEAMSRAAESRALADELLKKQQMQEELATKTYLIAKRNYDSIKLIVDQTKSKSLE